MRVPWAEEPHTHTTPTPPFPVSRQLASSYTTGGGKDVGRIKYMLQAKGRPPTFVAWVSGSASMPSSTQNFLTKSLRAEFGLEGVPIRLKVRAKESRRPK